MIPSDYRIESAHPIVGPLLPVGGCAEYLVSERGMAVVMAAKSDTQPSGQEIRVIHVPTGEVVFRKTSTLQTVAGNDL